MNRIVGYTVAVCCILSGCGMNEYSRCYKNYPFEKKEYSPYYEDAIWRLYEFNFAKIQRDALHQQAGSISQLELRPMHFEVKNDTIAFYFFVILNGRDLSNKFWSGVAFDPKAPEKIQLLVGERRWFTFLRNEESSEFAYFVKNNRDSLPDILECLAKKKGVL
jgi:hypothetical protein